MTGRPISVLLADDHALLRNMLEERLNDEADIDVVAARASAEEALREAASTRPDVVLLDIDMPGLSPFEAAKKMAEICPETRVIFLSAFVQDSYIEQALTAKASGYLTKSELPETVAQAIRNVVSGATCFSPQVLQRIVIDSAGVRLSDRTRTRAELLTPREKEVLGYIAQGMPKKLISRTMDISVKTIEHHTSHIMDKLDIHDRVELARFAIREGLVDP
jgi:DNA-binding NarL/FixJ family response regulator